MSTYLQPMSMRKIFAIVIAVAVLFAPAFAGANMAYAAVPNHHAQMMEKGHCEPATDEGQNKPASKMACCGAMCTAVAVNPATNLSGKALLGNAPVASLHAFHAGTPAELATPPPRAA